MGTHTQLNHTRISHATHTHTHTTQERSQETGNDSRRKSLLQREDRYQQASIREKRGGRGRTSSRAAGNHRTALDTTEEKTAG